MRQRPISHFRSDQTVETLRGALASDPTNVEIADRYWHALAHYNGQDVRSGRDVIQAYRSVALHSPQGALALARAYRELFETSGEQPRVEYLDKDLIQALNKCCQELGKDERSIIDWILTKIGAQH